MTDVNRICVHNSTFTYKNLKNRFPSYFFSYKIDKTKIFQKRLCHSDLYGSKIMEKY